MYYTIVCGKSARHNVKVAGERVRVWVVDDHPASIEAALCFCCSEALQNAAKHGGPGTTVTITVHADDRMLTLTISDTGRGFDPATVGTQYDRPPVSRCIHRHRPNRTNTGVCS